MRTTKGSAEAVLT
uniref:Uncharacterized protein n=1 Tax=Anguilla anguilla TaxID=7936 RepID=A0A0E9SH30_ANGAN